MVKRSFPRPGPQSSIVRVKLWINGVEIERTFTTPSFATVGSLQKLLQQEYRTSRNYQMRLIEMTNVQRDITDMENIPLNQLVSYQLDQRSNLVLHAIFTPSKPVQNQYGYFNAVRLLNRKPKTSVKTSVNPKQFVEVPLGSRNQSDGPETKKRKEENMSMDCTLIEKPYTPPQFGTLLKTWKTLRIGG